MAARIRIEMNYPEMIRIMQSPAVAARLLTMGNAVASAARAAAGRDSSPRYMVTSRTGRTRARVSVITSNDDARRDEAISRSLTRALDAARGA